MTMEKDIDEDQEYYRGIYSKTMEYIRLYHTDYPYIQKGYFS
jgi:hypothetical protein